MFCLFCFVLNETYLGRPSEQSLRVTQVVVDGSLPWALQPRLFVLCLHGHACGRHLPFLPSTLEGSDLTPPEWPEWPVRAGGSLLSSLAGRPEVLWKAELSDSGLEYICCAYVI